MWRKRCILCCSWYPLDGAPEGTFDGALKDALSNLHKDAQNHAFEAALKSASEVTL